MRLNAIVLLAVGVFSVHAAAKPVIADLELLEASGAEILATQMEVKVGYANLTEEQELRLQNLAHLKNRCGGYESLSIGEVDGKNPALTYIFSQLTSQASRNRRFIPSTAMFANVAGKAEIISALEEVSAEKIKETVVFLSNFNDRYYRSSEPNKHVEAVKSRIEALLKDSPLKTSIDLITHSSIQQKSIRVRIQGSQRPDEIIVMGGHLDSISNGWGSSKAPGADDNASGSADIMEALRILLTKKQPERTIEFFLYAGEEGGLIGSSEIAKTYKTNGTNVIAVLQLDMTMYPGAGKFVLGSMTDFTSAWMRAYLETINGLYLHVKIAEDRCGYGCSDHASWHRQGYPALMPFEATMRNMNRNIHSARDVIDEGSNFEHAAMFAKIALVIGMDLANSTLQEPK